MIVGAVMALALAAALIVAQGQLNGVLQTKIGLIGTIFWSHIIVALIAAPLVVYFYQNIAESVRLRLFDDGQYPVLIGGVMGIAIVPAIAFAIPVMGVKNAFFCLVVMQMAFSIGLEWLVNGAAVGLRDIAGFGLVGVAGWLLILR
ncbi:DMT family transporter [Terrarubrum flagellatum]|uniref:DMT family transporter n=1 Tax=Terrirubrum flagellatum TaxID=2895980 RepID=UPI0031451153